MLRATSLAAALLFTAALPALAQNRQIDERQYRQDQRVERGFYRGDLTRREVQRIEQEQRRIDRMQRQAMADGRMSRREKQNIQVAQNRLNAMIRHERHDRQYR